MTARSRELSNEIARRAIAAAARRRAEPDEVAQRLRDAANENGLLSVDDALGALGGEQPSSGGSFNEEIRRQAEDKSRRSAGNLFGREEPEPEASGRPQGSADAGRGEPDDAVFEETPHGRMRVFDLDDNETEGTN